MASTPGFLLLPVEAKQGSMCLLQACGFLRTQAALPAAAAGPAPPAAAGPAPLAALTPVAPARILRWKARAQICGRNLTAFGFSFSDFNSVARWCLFFSFFFLEGFPFKVNQPKNRCPFFPWPLGIYVLCHKLSCMKRGPVHNFPKLTTMLCG